MDSKLLLNEALVNAILTEGVDNEFEYLLNQIKEQEINFYQDIANKVYQYDVDNRAKSEPKDNSPEESAKWNAFIQGLYALSDDYDVSDYVYMLRQGKSKEEQHQRLEKNINEHIDKLRKSVTKVIGNVIEANKVADNTFNLEGEKGTCTLQVTPVKLSSTNKVIKARFKVDNVEEKVITVDKEPSVLEESEYVKAWKQKELEGFIRARDYYLKHSQELSDAEDKAKEDLRIAKQKYIDEHGTEPRYEKVNGNVVYEDPVIDDLRQKLRNAEREYRAFRQSGNGTQFYAMYGRDSNFEERCKKIVDDHFKELQTKVQKKIGRIIKIEDLGGDDYAFEGENGKCVVEVIWAGGYNIQRLHTRWIVKNWNLED